jgi:hypothetical protein
MPVRKSSAANAKNGTLVKRGTASEGDSMDIGLPSEDWKRENNWMRRGMTQAAPITSIKTITTCSKMHDFTSWRKATGRRQREERKKVSISVN